LARRHENVPAIWGEAPSARWRRGHTVADMETNASTDRISLIALGLVLALSNAVFFQQALTYAY
jgi:hypothetical protein